MALRDDLLPVVDSLRGLAGEFGFRPFTAVTLRTRTWSGGRPGAGAAADATLALTAGGQPAKVRRLSTREVHGSAGRYTEGDLLVGPLTPAFTRPDLTTGGYTAAALTPTSTSRAVERHVVLVGPGEPAGGSVWTIVDARFEGSLGYTLVITRTERTA